MAGVSKELTFSGLLNVLDGALGANKGLIMVLTTNRFERLKQDRQSADALLRPGRVSKLAHFGNPTGAQLRAYFLRLFNPSLLTPAAAPVDQGQNSQTSHAGSNLPLAGGGGGGGGGGDGGARAVSSVAWLAAAADAFISGLREAFPSGDHCSSSSTGDEEEEEKEEEGRSYCWRCPWNFQEVKGLLMQPTAKRVVEQHQQHHQQQQQQR